MAKSKSGILFCSRKCKDAGQMIENGLKEIWHGKHKDGRYAYRQRAIKFYGPKCAECNFSFETLLTVHHRDRNRANGSIKNLIVLCPNHHALRHVFEGKLKYHRKL